LHTRQYFATNLQPGYCKRRSEKGLFLRNLSLAFAATAFVFVASSSFAADTDTSATPATPAAATPAPATTTTDAAATPAAPSTQAASGVDPNAIVCKRLAPETGTRLGSRTQCRTNAQWDQITREAESGMRDAQQRNSGAYVHPPGVSGH
jgi:hypothetical protein